MRIFRHERAEDADRGAAVAIGNFDGLHPGHQAVIAAAGRAARAAGAPHAVLTFEPHPYAVFHPAAAPFRLTPFRSKARHIEALGVDLLFALHFDREFAKRTAEQFVDDILVRGLGARHVVVGDDFVFGNQRRGTAEFLLKVAPARGFAVIVVERVMAPAGEIYSSTRIREHLTSARPREAAKLLGRWWEIDGRVEHDTGVGKDLGYPTANLPLADYLRPASGIYAAFAGIEDGKRTDWFPAAAYVGTRPTLGAYPLGLEAYLIDFAGDLYGRHLRVALVEHLRPDAAFAGLEALKVQIGDDIAQARRALAGEKPEP
ncbi:MAG: bifunctional riboflavin kinase/FAD synthetase [Alphaproteobacteria bacterium]|nr:bifunctional riboflavin kinase/FAD synthetase [Alphaproteobacteria bacterium]